MAAFVKVTNLHSTTGSASGSVSATASNALIAAATVSGANTNPTLTVSGGGTWATDYSAYVGGGVNIANGFASCTSATGGSNTITLAWSTDNFCGGFVYEFSGMATSSIFDVADTTNSGSFGSGNHTLSTNALSNNVASDVFVAMVGLQSNTTVTWTTTGTGFLMPTGASDDGSGGSFDACASAYQIVSSVASQTESWTANDAGAGTDQFMCTIACYKQATVATIPPGLGPVVQMQEPFHLDAALMR